MIWCENCKNYRKQTWQDFCYYHGHKINITERSYCQGFQPKEAQLSPGKRSIDSVEKNLAQALRLVCDSSMRQVDVVTQKFFLLKGAKPPIFGERVAGKPLSNNCRNQSHRSSNSVENDLNRSKRQKRNSDGKYHYPARPVLGSSRIRAASRQFDKPEPCRTKVENQSLAESKLRRMKEDLWTMCGFDTSLAVASVLAKL